MTKFYDTVAETKYDGLIVAANPSPQVFSVTIPKAAADATLKRGTILEKSDGDDGTVAYAILADDVEVSKAAAVNAIAYRSGHFARNIVKNTDGSAVTAEQEDALRKYNILLSDAIPVE